MGMFYVLSLTLPPVLTSLNYSRAIPAIQDGRHARLCRLDPTEGEGDRH